MHPNELVMTEREKDHIKYDEDMTFAETISLIAPLAEKLNEFMTGDRQFLTRQKWQMDNNNMRIAQQQAELAKNKGLIDDSSRQAESIIARAKEKAKEIENVIAVKFAEASQRERETKQKLEEANKALWEAGKKDKK